MKTVALVLLFVGVLSATPVQYVAQIERDVQADNNDMQKLRYLTDRAMNGAIERAIKELRKKNQNTLADRINFEWQSMFGASVWNTRGIGDHAGLSSWITETYRMIEASLGKEVCISMHIASILTLNHAIPVVFKPCAFPLDGLNVARIDEYRNHFAMDMMNDYHGLAMEVTYWATVLGMSAAGIPGGNVAASMAEKIMGNYVAPPLSDWVFKKSCGG